MFEAGDSMVVMLAGNLVAQVVGYYAVVGLVFLLVWRWGRERLAGRRIPAPARFGREQFLREFRNTLVTFAAGTVSAGAVVALHARGLSRLSSAPTPAWATLAWTVAFVAFNDAWFYGWHRLLHHPRLFRYVHAVHHKSVDVNPFTSYSFHALEGFILGAWVIPVSVLLPLPMASLGLLQLIGLSNNVMSHLGYELLPAWLLRVPLLRWTNTATFHSLHHTNLHGNFGLHTRLWDRLFGTELPEYERVFVDRGAAARDA